jgi:hypothetical protein
MNKSGEDRPDAAEGSSEERAMEEFAQRPTTMPDIGVDLRGFATEDQAKAVGAGVLSTLHALGKILNLKRLRQVIVAYDYDAALAELDRGTLLPTKALTATKDEIAVGIAMAPKVLRDGETACVMVLNAAHMSVLAQTDNPELAALRDEMTYTLAHECGHVHDLDVQESSFPNVILRTALPFKDGILFYIASGCWEEYIACRLSAFFGTETTLRAYQDTFCVALQSGKERADAAIRQYRMHHDVGRVANEVAEVYKRVLVYASYLFGHLDGLDASVADKAPKALQEVASRPCFELFFARLHGELRALYATYNQWKSIDIFEPLKRLAYDVLKTGGIDIQDRPGGAGYVDIPFTPETIPTLVEQAAFLAARQSGNLL